ncbi:MAG: iron-only hydrogenase system regulator [Spirochaetaceae bacterium]|jgi:putative iron-only hydrogenase system regulator|nr:iron-only hydrogenase system regulator [Spirochaetaceae bacterium]
MKRIAVIGAVLEKPHLCQKLFNETIANFRGIIRGRMGTPFDDEDMTVIAITVIGELNDINALTGKLGSLPNVTVKTAVSNTLPDHAGS